jgi:hypothetical protein
MPCVAGTPSPTPSTPPSLGSSVTLDYPVVSGRTHQFGSHSFVETRKKFSATNWADHFNIRTATSPRYQPFQPHVFDYEWCVYSNINPDAFSQVYFPFSKTVPIQIKGKLRVPPRQPGGSVVDYSSVEIRVPTPDGNKLSYFDHYNITSTGISVMVGGTTKTLPAAHITTNPNLLQTINKDGEWKITLNYFTPPDPTTNGCFYLPLTIIVTAGDGITQRMYRIHNVGSDRTSCFNSLARKTIESLRAKKEVQVSLQREANNLGAAIP